MSEQQIEVLKAFGNMDLDNEPVAVGEGYVRFAKNVTQIRDATGKGTSSKATYGNKHAVNIGSIDSQNKRFRIYLPDGFTYEMRIEISHPNGGGVGLTWDFNEATTSSNSGPIAFQTQAVAYFGSLTGESAIIVVGDGYVDFEYSTHDFFDYNLKAYFPGTGQEIYDYVVIREAISSDLAGRLIPIMSYDLNGDLFIWSTTQRNEPTETTLKISGIGPISSGQYSGPLTQLFFNQEHNLEVGQVFEITHAEHYWLNGIFVVQEVVSSTDIRIATELTWGATVNVTPANGNEKIFIHPEAVGEIGVLTENKDADTWDYKRLIRTKDFPFRTVWTLDIPTVERNNYRISFYFTDGHDSLRALYYLEDYVVDGFLGHVNGNNGMYWYGHLDEPTRLIPPQTKAEITLDEQLNDGGNLTVGNKRYTIRQLNRFLVPTGWSFLSGAVPVYGPSNVENPNNRVAGAIAGTETGKINSLAISKTDRYAYDFIEIGVVEYIDDNLPVGSVLYRIPTKNANIGETGLQVMLNQRHNGYEESYDLPLSDLAEYSSELFDTARNLSTEDNILIASVLRKEEEDDLTSWFQTFQHRIMRRPMNAALNEDFSKVGEYQEIDNAFNYIGYMDNEAYRLGGMLRNRETGKWTKVFHIDDIRMDPFPDNEFSTRRDQTGPVTGSANLKENWGITEDTSGNTLRPETGVDYAVQATYFELFGADMRTLINGVPIRQKYDKILIVRPDTVETVLCTGICVMGAAAVNRMSLDAARLPSGVANFDTSGNQGRSKSLWDTNSGRSVQEFPLFTSFFDVHQSANNRFLAINYPLNAVPGQGFGNTQANAGSGVWDELYLNGNNKNPLEAFPNVLSFYSPDLLYGKVTPDTIKEGRYKIRHMGDHDSSVRTLDQDPSRWGRSRSGYAEFHPYPHPYTGSQFNNWTDYDIIRAEPVGHGGETQLDSFDYNRIGQFDSPLSNIPITSEPEFFAHEYKRNYNAVNIAAGNTWGTAGEGVDDVQFIENLWVNSPCMVIQTSHESGGYPIITTNHAKEDQRLIGGPNDGDFAYDFNIGTFYAQIVRDMDQPYGNTTENTVYRHICAEFNIGLDDSTIEKLDWPVFGGDTFAQGTYIQNRMASEATRETDILSWHDMFTGCGEQNEGLNGDSRPGWGSTFKMYSQNRINSHFFYASEQEFLYLADTADKKIWTEKTDETKSLFKYNGAYTPALITNVFTAYNKSLPSRESKDGRLQWSERSAVDSLTDRYRIWPFNNNKDLEITDGPVVWHKGLNGELVTWQDKSFIRQFFNAAGQLMTREGELNVSIGDGSVMSRPGVTLSTYGCSEREAIIFGKSDGGKDLVFWFNSKTFQFLRFGEDGTKVISDKQPIYTWIRDNAKWVENENSPYEMYGIRGLWDDAYKEAVWTFTGRRRTAEWAGNGVAQIQALIGAVVSNPNQTEFSGFHQLPDLFKCILGHSAASNTEPGVGADWQTYWEVIPHTDKEYYTEFSICWNEVKNGFSCFYGPMPRIYMSKDNQSVWLTNHPKYTNEIFVHRRGVPLKWWELNGEAFVDDAYIDLVMNKIPEESKRYYALHVSSDLPPQYTELFTPGQTSYLNEDEWTQFKNGWRSPIKNDSTNNGLNNQDTDMLFGEYIIIRMYFMDESVNAVRSCILKYNYSPRSIAN